MYNCLSCGNNILGDIKIDKNGKYIKSYIKKFHKDILDDKCTCKPKVCYTCFENKFGPVKRGLSKDQFIWAYKPSQEELENKFNSYGYTLQKSIDLYGKEEGTKKWNEYCEKQSHTNSLEYKKEKHGWTEEEFKEYNKSRSQTLENMINRYGKEEGTKKWNEYCEKQSYAGSSLEYFIDKLGINEGTKKWNKINKSKALTLENMINRYGIEEGTKKFNECINTKYSSYSKISQELFWNIYNDLENELKDKTYFAELNYEFGKYDDINKGYRKYDFVISNIKFCIEFNGDHDNGNPEMYNKNDRLKVRGCKHIKVKDVWKKDKEKKQLLLNENFSYFVIWEKDYLNNKEEIKEMFIKIIKEKYLRYKNDKRRTLF